MRSFSMNHTTSRKQTASERGLSLEEVLPDILNHLLRVLSELSDLRVRRCLIARVKRIRLHGDYVGMQSTGPVRKNSGSNTIRPSAMNMSIRPPVKRSTT